MLDDSVARLRTVNDAKAIDDARSIARATKLITACGNETFDLVAVQSKEPLLVCD